MGPQTMRTNPSEDVVRVPHGYPTSLIFIDESGSKATASQFFVVAAVKVREPGKLSQAVRDVRDATGYGSELKFSAITRGTLPVYYSLIDTLEASDAHLAACVVQGDVHNPFRGQKHVWRVHAEIISQLLVGCINRRELVGVLMDGITTPKGCSLEDTVRKITNRRLGETTVVSAACLDSQTNDILQIADLVAGAILHERRLSAGEPRGTVSNKGRVALRLAAAFGRPGLIDGRDGRVNIQTYRGRTPVRPGAGRVVQLPRRLDPPGA
jgi:hypothetical protein